MRAAIEQAKTLAHKSEKRYSEAQKESKAAMEAHKKELETTSKLEEVEEELVQEVRAYLSCPMRGSFLCV